VAFDVSMGSSTKSVATPDLKSRLEEWLTKRGKTPDKFTHLRCFGCRAKDFEEKSFVLHRRKVQIATPPPSLLQDTQASPELKGSKQTATVSLLDSIIEPDLPEQSEPIEELNCELVLQELSELVAMDYPTDFCKEWLDRIKDQWTESSDNFFYWDILAKLALRNHDTKGAVKYYEEALKKDTQTGYDEYMQAAKQKLNDIKLNGPSNDKSVFESTLHKFYVHTPQSRRSGPRTPKVSFVATPVRRSARLSVQGQSGCIDSLFALSADMRNNLVVKQNQALL